MTLTPEQSAAAKARQIAVNTFYEELEHVEKTKREQELDKAAGLARLETYAEPPDGLIDSQQNANALAEWLNEHQLQISVVNIDTAIAALKAAGKLQYKVPPPPPPPKRLSNGELEIPLNETPNNRHSAAQLKDWLKRTRESEPYVRNSDSFSSKF